MTKQENDSHKNLKSPSIPITVRKIPSTNRMNTEDTHMMDTEDMAKDMAEESNENHNVKELQQLKREIDCIMAEGLNPPEPWYRKRHHNIEIYSELGWLTFAHRFNEVDRHIHNTALNIINNIFIQILMRIY